MIHKYYATGRIKDFFDTNADEVGLVILCDGCAREISQDFEFWPAGDTETDFWLAQDADRAYDECDNCLSPRR